MTPASSGPGEWILIPASYQPDTKDSREENGRPYVKYYSESAYLALTAQLERVTAEANEHFQLAQLNSKAFIAERQKLARAREALRRAVDQGVDDGSLSAALEEVGG